MIFNIHKYWFAVLAVLPYLLYSCKTETSKGQAIRVDMLKSVDAHNIEDVIDSIKIIPLETTDQSLIKDIELIKTIDNDWYVYYYDVPIKRFSQDGTFVTELGKKGQGPGEFIQISDFFVNKDTVNLFAWSGNRKWIRMRNDNTFLYETEMSFPFDEIYRLNNTNYLLDVGNGTMLDGKSMSHYLYIIDTSFHVQKKLFPKVSPYDIEYSFFQQSFCQGSDGDVLYLKDLDSHIYSISPSMEVTLKYWLDFGEIWISKKFIKNFYKKIFLKSIASLIKEATRSLWCSAKAQTI